jgi:hypothetical protein
MRKALIVIMAAASASAAVAAEPETLIYSNEEQVYFAKEAGQPAPPLVHVKVKKDPSGAVPPHISGHDAFGAPATVDAALLNGVGEFVAGAPGFDADSFAVKQGDGPRYELRRARRATCWVAIRKAAPKADGSPDWHFAQGVRLHDQGGRALVSAEAPNTPPVMIRMRNVVWPPKPGGTPSTNKPSIVLYVHKPEEPDKAEAYAWGDPGAARIGINLRWMQASCGIDGMETPSALTATNFRG